ncbi:hypothetical protein [Agrobacterium sp. SORGH_AS 787]|uniref:hypothetical protein n=1 Tax=Agrobacterium sp. SORGH_AS 787 TaxID=3041775 RepID=UPI00278A46A5|nr:hypothetical protein [Rhizobium sp. SORGH_AS_0787]
MLPPVSAVTAGELSSQTAGQKQDAVSSPVSQRTAPQAISDTSPNSPVVAARAVSGEAELHRTGTVLTEVLGSLLRMERLEGEDAEAYVTRLTSALQSLPLAQKAALEQQLGKLLKGMTIALMLDILKNNAGPNAARLAVMLELARVGQSKDGVKVTLPPYLQDLLPDSPALTLLPSKAPPPAFQVPRAPLTADQSVSPPGKPLPTTPAPTGELIDDTSSPASTAAQTSTEASARITAQTPLRPQGTTPATASIPAAPGAPQASPPATQAQAAFSGNAGSSIAPPPNAELPMMMSNDAMDDAALAPFSKADAATIAAQLHGASPQEMEKLLLAVLLGRVPERADPLVGTLSALPIPPHEEASDAEATKKQQATTSRQTQDDSAGLPNEETPNGIVRPEAQAAARALAATDGKTIVFEQAALQSAVASLATKPGTPLPFINYPIEEQRRDEDAPPRGRWPSSDGGSEGEAGEEAGNGQADQNDASRNNPDDPSGQEERVAANDEPVDHSVSDGAREDGRVGDAESYYLRMGNFA